MGAVVLLKHSLKLFLSIEVSAWNRKWLGWHYKSFHVLISSREQRTVRPCHHWFSEYFFKEAGLVSSLSLDQCWSVTAQSRKGEEREQLCLLYNFVWSSGDWGVILVLVPRLAQFLSQSSGAGCSTKTALMGTWLQWKLNLFYLDFFFSFSLEAEWSFDPTLLCKYRELSTALCGYESGRKRLEGRTCRVTQSLPNS